MKTEMAANPKQKDTESPKPQPTAQERRLAGLKAREAGLKAKIERIPTFNADTRDQALERAQAHLSDIQAEIKKATS